MLCTYFDNKKTNTMLRKLIATGAGLIISIMVFAQGDSTKKDTLPTPTPMPPSAMAGPSPMTTPGMAGPLQANPRPFGYSLGHFGTMYVTGAVSGIGQWQNNKFPGDHTFQAD